MLVVDANVVAYLLIEGDKTERARGLWQIDRDWRAPRLLTYELANVFAQLVLQGALAFEVAHEGLGRGLALVRLVDREPDAGRILEIATGLRLSAYDTTYLATAEALRVPLVTEDARLLRAAPEVAKSLASFCGSDALSDVR